MSLIGEIEKLARGWRWGHRPLVPRSAQLPELTRREFPTEWARTPAAKAARAAILRIGFAPLLYRELDLQIRGREVLDELPMPVLFAANHSSHLDAPVILNALPRRWRHMTAVGAASDYFFDVWWRAVGTALAFNTFPVERTGMRRSAGMAGRLLNEGWNILVFPEGTRSTDGWMGEFKPGIAYLSTTAGVPIVPLSLRGTYQSMPKGRNWPAPGRQPVEVRFGEPIWPMPEENHKDLIVRVRAVLERLMDESGSTWWESMRRSLSSESVPRAVPPEARWRRMWESSRPIESRREQSRVWRS